MAYITVNTVADLEHPTALHWASMKSEIKYILRRSTRVLNINWEKYAHQHPYLFNATRTPPMRRILRAESTNLAWSAIQCSIRGIVFNNIPLTLNLIFWSCRMLKYQPLDITTVHLQRLFHTLCHQALWGRHRKGHCGLKFPMWPKYTPFSGLHSNIFLSMPSFWVLELEKRIVPTKLCSSAPTSIKTDNQATF